MHFTSIPTTHQSPTHRTLFFFFQSPEDFKRSHSISLYFYETRFSLSVQVFSFLHINNRLILSETEQIYSQSLYFQFLLPKKLRRKFQHKRRAFCFGSRCASVTWRTRSLFWFRLRNCCYQLLRDANTPTLMQILHPPPPGRWRLTIQSDFRPVSGNCSILHNGKLKKLWGSNRGMLLLQLVGLRLKLLFWG